MQTVVWFWDKASDLAFFSDGALITLSTESKITAGCRVLVFKEALPLFRDFDYVFTTEIEQISISIALLRLTITLVRRQYKPAHQENFPATLIYNRHYQGKSTRFR